MAIDLDSVFRFKFSRLLELCQSLSSFDYLELSAILRHFLIDEVRLPDQINRQFRMSVRFSIAHVSPDSSAFKVIKGSIAVHPEFIGEKIKGKMKRDTLKLSEFLSLPIIDIDGKSYTVRDIISAGANIGGGVHSSVSGKSRILHNLAYTIFGSHCDVGAQILRHVARLVCDQYKNMFDALVSDFGDLRQSVNEKQPRVVLDSQQVFAEFSGHQYFETAVKIVDEDSLILEMVLCINRKQLSRNPIIWQIGRVDPTTQPLASVCIHNNNVVFEHILDNNKFVNVSIPVIYDRFILLTSGFSFIGDKTKTIIHALGFKKSCKFTKRRIALNFSGKETFGCGIDGGQGVVMQLCLMCKPRTFFSKREKQTIADRMSGILNTGWRHHMEGLEEGYMTRLYNQVGPNTN